MNDCPYTTCYHRLKFVNQYYPEATIRTSQAGDRIRTNPDGISVKSPLFGSRQFRFYRNNGFIMGDSKGLFQYKFKDTM